MRGGIDHDRHRHTSLISGTAIHSRAPHERAGASASASSPAMFHGKMTISSGRSANSAARLTMGMRLPGR